MEISVGEKRPLKDLSKQEIKGILEYLEVHETDFDTIMEKYNISKGDITLLVVRALCVR